MWVPLASPWNESTLGGIVATNFNAPLRMRYGALRDLVLTATVALPNGRVIRAGRPLVKNVAGYDISKLFVGSYGTLGVITDVTLKLAPLPRARQSHRAGGRPGARAGLGRAALARVPGGFGLAVVPGLRVAGHIFALCSRLHGGRLRRRCPGRVGPGAQRSAHRNF